MLICSLPQISHLLAGMASLIGALVFFVASRNTPFQGNALLDAKLGKESNHSGVSDAFLNRNFHLDRPSKNPRQSS